MNKDYLNNDPAPCPRCGTKYQAGRAVYTKPCGCYLGSYKLATKPVLKKGDQLGLF